MEASGNTSEDCSEAGSNISSLWLFQLPFSSLQCYLRGHLDAHSISAWKVKERVCLDYVNFAQCIKADRNEGKNCYNFRAFMDHSIWETHSRWYIKVRYWISIRILAIGVNFQTLCFASFTNLKSIIKKSLYRSAEET